jgi:hypothetical protein
LKILETKNRSKINERFTKKRSLKKKRKNVFYVEIDLRLIFAQFTTYFRIHLAKSTAFLIHEKWSFSMNFNKIITNNSIWILTRSKWSTAQLAMPKIKISRMKLRSFLEIKKILHNNKWKSQVFRFLNASNAILSRSCSFCWSRQMTKWSKNQHQLTKINKNINKEIFFHFNEFVELIIQTVILKKKIMLRSRLEHEYVTINHWHDLNRIELNNSTDLANSSINRINSTSMIVFKSFVNEIENEQWDLRREFYKWVFNKLMLSTTWVRLVNETVSIQKRSRS